MAKFLNKISVNTVCPGWGDEPVKEPVELMHVAGLISRVETGTVQQGKETRTYYKFCGHFVAVNLLTGEHCGPAPVLFLPDGAAQMIAGIDFGGQPIKVCLKIGARPADNSVGYQYDVASLPGDESHAAMANESFKMLLGSPGDGDIQPPRRLNAAAIVADIRQKQAAKKAAAGSEVSRPPPVDDTIPF
jgi:hypothetical protein